MQDWLVMQVFYGGLGSHTKTVVDAAAGGAFLNKDYAEAYELLEELSAKLDQVLSFQTTLLKGNLGEGIEGLDEVNYIGNNPYSNTYNLGWCNHSNFSWKNQGQGNPPFQQQSQ
ncbi:hypothetical protein L6164_002606 [Bauhinia variegata]|uniref:Uncharacterized protein n=1 Tax=Bauhinia variegata TaxID=167791 RepID=A0ACB9Q476_BAUVA|nr:hypothetical protein L6164_002606 [Bauhinia variegata]